MIRRLHPVVYVGQLVGRGSPWRQNCDIDLRHTASLPKRFVYWTLKGAGWRTLSAVYPAISVLVFSLSVSYKTGIDHVQTWVDYTTLPVRQSNSPNIVLRMETKCTTTAHAANIAAQWHGGYAYLSVILELSVSTDPECTYLTIKLALSSVSC